MISNIEIWKSIFGYGFSYTVLTHFITFFCNFLNRLTVIEKIVRINTQVVNGLHLGTIGSHLLSAFTSIVHKKSAPLQKVVLKSFFLTLQIESIENWNKQFCSEHRIGDCWIIIIWDFFWRDYKIEINKWLLLFFLFLKKISL